MVERMKINLNNNEIAVKLFKKNATYKTIAFKDIVDDIDLKIDLRKEIAIFKQKGQNLASYKFNYGQNKYKPKSKKALKKAIAKLNKITGKEYGEVFNADFFEDLELFMLENYEEFKNQESSLIMELKEAPKNAKLIMELSEMIEKEFNIKKVVDRDEKATFYYLDGNSYELLTNSKLAELINQRYGLRLPEKSIDDALKSIPTISEAKDYLWEFNNCYLDTRTYEIVDFEEPQITPKKVGITRENEFIKIDYTPDVEIDSDYPTLVEKTLKEILIPKDDGEDMGLYWDFLQRLGASRIPNNKHKIITEYNGSGDDGKSTLSHLMKLIYGDYFIGTTGDSMRKDMFNAHYLGNKHIIIIDEISEYSLSAIWDALKRISSGINNTSTRGAYEKNPTTNIKYGTMWIFSNISPNLDYVDEAILERYDILEMPNKFVSQPKEENEYKKDPNLFYSLSADTKGLEWLINMSIKAYMLCDGQFMMKQSKEETMERYHQTDDISNFLRNYTSLSNSDRTAMPELVDAYITYAKAENINLEEKYSFTTDIRTAISKEIGRKLSKIYDPEDLDKRENADRKKEYGIVLTGYRP